MFEKLRFFIKTTLLLKFFVRTKGNKFIKKGVTNPLRNGLTNSLRKDVKNSLKIALRIGSETAL